MGEKGNGDENTFMWRKYFFSQPSRGPRKRPNVPLGQCFNSGTESKSGCGLAVLLRVVANSQLNAGVSVPFFHFFS